MNKSEKLFQFLQEMELKKQELADLLKYEKDMYQISFYLPEKNTQKKHARMFRQKGK